MRILTNLLCCFIPIKSVRKKVRNYYKSRSLKYLIEKDRPLLNEIYWANVFRDTIQDSEWLLNKSFSPGRMALSYIALYCLYRILNDIKPNCILECGLGQSSRMTIQYIDFYKKDLIIFEQEKEWLNFFSLQFPTAKQYTKIIDVNLINIISEEKSRIFVDYKDKIQNKKFDFIIVDAPTGSDRYSRYQLVDFINYINIDNFIVMFDDTNRIGELETLKVFKEKLQEKNVEFIEAYYCSNKGTTIICSPRYKFLTSL